MRTDQEILARIEEVESDDWLGFEQGDLIAALSFEAAKPFLKPEAEASEWKPASDPLEDLREYMAFAWDKANNNRGISAGRSLSHIRAWLWLAGEDEFLSRVDLMEYSHYGKPQLRAICEHLGIDWTQHDDGRWTNDERGDGVGPDDVSAVA